MPLCSKAAYAKCLFHGNVSAGIERIIGLLFLLVSDRPRIVDLGRLWIIGIMVGWKSIIAVQLINTWHPATMRWLLHLGDKRVSSCIYQYFDQCADTASRSRYYEFTLLIQSSGCYCFTLMQLCKCRTIAWHTDIVVEELKRPLGSERMYC